MNKVSIIIPVYKAEKYIAATLQSALDQTYKNIEILIIDDGSPDRSIEICQQFTDSRIRIIRQENRGLAGARNTGIRQAQGEFLALIDADDLWLPGKLEKHIAHLEKSPEVGVSFSRSAFIDEAGQPLGTYHMPKLTGITPPYLLCHDPVGNGSAGVFRREVFEGIRFQDNLRGYLEDFYFEERFRMSQDMELLLRIALQTPWQIEGIPEALTLYRVTSGTISTNWFKKIEAWEKVIERVRTYAPELIAQCANQSRAYQLRHLARRAVRLQAQGNIAMQLINRTLATHWRILLEEPRPTLMTLAAAYLLWLLPQSGYANIETIVAKITGFLQRQYIPESQSEPSI
ncbi:glucosyl transferase [Nostoc sp. T09]|uniref:glycosyltransferase family 2 protein n=1 Tax=Nostoc sp. T09 TaxID=1932621 RepID=UPI000A374739|nr:glycosyltransferase family 2 protein [Nostoc sp. T09]OUL33347.1 glucosyl transferase [Nostoc sp. T09]